MKLLAEKRDPKSPAKKLVFQPLTLKKRVSLTEIHRFLTLGAF